MLKTMKVYQPFMLLIALSYFWCVSGAHYSNQDYNTYSPIPMSNRIIEMLRDRNAELDVRVVPKPIALHKSSSPAYFSFMKSLANRQGIQYNTQPIPLEPPKLPYLQYTLPAEQMNGKEKLCERLRIC